MFKNTFILPLLLLHACSILKIQNSVSTKAKFKLTNPNPSSWREIDLPNVDRAFQNENLQATFYVFSLCDPETSLTLEQLQNNILKGFDNLVTSQNRSIQLEKREGISTEFAGKLDGINVSGIVVNLQKDFCQFDFVLVETKKTILSEKAKQEFNEFMKGFKF